MCEAKRWGFVTQTILKISTSQVSFYTTSPLLSSFRKDCTFLVQNLRYATLSNLTWILSVKVFAKCRVQGQTLGARNSGNFQDIN